jgi:soluble lytic murein transglycosylase-like protein
MNRARGWLWGMVGILAVIAAAFMVYAGLAVLAPMQAAHAQVPDAAWAYQRPITRQAQARFGPEAPVARIAAQLHQESAWRPAVCSGAGACGLAQFIPGTAAWMAELFPRELSPADPFDPAWAIQANVYYNHWLYQRARNWADECERWAGVLSAYNGGLTWVNRDRRLAAEAGADPARWFGAVEDYSRRADWAFRENRGYVRRVLMDLEPRYARAGWAGDPVCLRD